MTKLRTIKINGVLYGCNEKLSLTNLLEYLGFNLGVILVDYNGTIIHRSLWAKILIDDHDAIEILTLAGGG